jgi:hypothetical protein
MPLVVFLLLALVCLMLLGFACACLSDQPALALERALQAPALPGLVEVWALLALVAFIPNLFVGRVVSGRSRASPVLLQRFLF